MDDMINRNAPIAEENIDPNGRPAIDKFEEWSEESILSSCRSKLKN